LICIFIGTRTEYLNTVLSDHKKTTTTKQQNRGLLAMFGGSFSGLTENSFSLSDGLLLGIVTLCKRQRKM